MYFPAEQIRTDANKTTHKMVQFIKIKWIFTCHQVQMMEKVNVKFPSVNSLTNGRTMKGEVSVPVNEGSCQRNTHESRRYFMIAVEEEGVSFIFSPHSYSPDTHTHVLLQAGRQAAGDSQPPLGWEHLPPPPPPLPHPHWMVLFGFGSLSFTGQSSFHHPSTLSWKEALNILLQLLITCNELPCKCVCFFFFSHSLSLSLSISVVIGTVVTAVGSCSEMTVMPLLMLILFPSEHHRVIRQRFSPQGGDYICLCRQIL